MDANDEIFKRILDDQDFRDAARRLLRQEGLRAATGGSVTAHEDLPLVQDVSRWPFRVELPTISILPVRHFTGHSEINEGGYLVAIDGEALPCVFVGLAERPEMAEEPVGDPTGVTTLRYQLDDLLRSLLDSGGSRLNYASFNDVILDGWRPEHGDSE